MHALWIVLLAGAAVPVVVQLYLWLIVPWKIRSKGALALHPGWEATDAEKMTPEMREFIGTAVLGFNEEGFEVVSNLSPREKAYDAESFQVVLVNRTANDVAVLIAVKMKGSRSLVSVVRSEFADGTTLPTAACSLLGV